MPLIVVSAGIERSGSTWLFNVLRYAFLNAGLRTYGESFGCHDSRVDADACVLKTHFFDSDLQSESSFIFTSYRDLRDIAASLVRRDCIANNSDAVGEAVRELIEFQYKPWKTYSSYVFKYEEMIENRLGTVQRILDVLGLHSVDSRQVLRDVELLKLTVTANMDRTSMLFPGHITDGRAYSYAETLSSESIAVIEDIAGSWLLDHGYQLSYDRLPGQ